MKLLTLLILAVGVVLPARADSSPYTWPLDLDTRYLTSNFLETRQGRFHTGIDLKTEERTGLAVLAVDDGWISRIKFRPGGYGKAIYLTNGEGRTFVYAHLERLADPLRRRVQAAQHSRGVYAVDIYPAPGEFPVVRGEIIALSGQTATNGPHLHFEVRDGDGSPLNPLTHGFPVDDQLAPEITAVRVWWGNRSYRYGDGVQPLGGVLPALQVPAGPVQVSARIIERSDRLRYRLEPWSVDLSVDGWGTVGAGTNERLRWADNRRERVVFRETDLGRERALWQPGAGGRWQADGRGGQGPGVPDEPAGTTRTYRLRATDAVGNVAEVWWPVVVSDAAEPSSDGWLAEPAAAVSAQRQDQILDLDQAVAGTAAVRKGTTVSTLTAPVRQHYPTELELLTVPTWYLSEHPFPLEHLVDSLPVVVDWPDSLPGDPAVAVYVLDPDDGWEHAADLEPAGERWIFDLDQTGAHVLARDPVPPRITLPPRLAVAPSPAPARHGISLPRWQIVAVDVDDLESGLDWTASVVTVDDRRLIAEPDAPRRRLLIELPDDLAAGEHVLRVQVQDGAGHTASRLATLVVGVASDLK